MHEKGRHIVRGLLRACWLLTSHLCGGRAAMFTGLVLLTAPVHAQDTTYIQWDPPQQISFDPYNSVLPRIVAVRDTVHLVWTTSNGPHAFYARSTDAGSSWSVPVVLVGSAATTGGATFAAAESYGYVFWTRCLPPCNPTTYQYVVELRRSVDGGLTWLPGITIASDPRNSANYDEYSGARDTTIGFINTRGGLPNRFGWSWDTGLQWSFYDVGTKVFDRFVILSNGVHLVRRVTGIGLPRAEVGYLYSSNFGQTWTATYLLSRPDSILSDQPDIAGDDEGNLYALWRASNTVEWTMGRFCLVGAPILEIFGHQSNDLH